jgi:hypothetical protein
VATNTLSKKQFWSWPVIGAIIAISAYLLHTQGRLWICACGQVWLWSGDIWSADNSQHVADPYSFTHVLHGFVFFWILTWALPRLNVEWQLTLALFFEAAWEVVENSAFIIDRYREATLALGYNGDTVVNSLADILCCALGFWLARQLGFRRTLALFVLTELVLLLWIRDSLILNVIMLLYPIEAIKTWQIGG